MAAELTLLDKLTILSKRFAQTQMKDDQMVLVEMQLGQMKEMIEAMQYKNSFVDITVEQEIIDGEC
jgi:hypothetical protein